MKNEINAVLENMTTTIPEPEDYTGEDGLLYCGKCRKPKEAYFAPDKAAIFGRDRHPAECDCQRAAREEREAAEKRRRPSAECFICASNGVSKKIEKPM